jgi:hypothetical protein
MKNENSNAPSLKMNLNDWVCYLCWNTERGGESILVLLILFNHNVYCLLYEK